VLGDVLPIIRAPVDEEQLRDRIAEFARWHYRFEFDGGISTHVPDVGRINRQEQRRRYFFDALLSVTGGSLAGRRVLDLGCNAGLWSLAALEAGAEFVLGIDAQAVFIEQAQLVFEAKRIERSRFAFECRDIFGGERPSGFDVVLCLGVMEVTARPVELFELMRASGAELVVVDTGLARAGSSYFELARLDDQQPRVDHDVALVPTRHAVVELANEFGYQIVALARNITDYAGMEDYRRGRRLAFVCSQGPSLASLAREPEVGGPAWLPSAAQPVLARVRGRR
jgi:SAM-dependent methyltransferase